MKIANNIFSLLFVLIAIVEFVGFIGGRNHCFFAAIACYAISRIFIIDSIKSKEYSKIKERRQS